MTGSMQTLPHFKCMCMHVCVLVALCLFQVGTKVLRKDFRRKKRQGGKLDPQWLGPYRVIHDLGKGFYSLGNMVDGSVVTQRINGAHLKVYCSPPASPTEHHSLHLHSTCTDESVTVKKLMRTMVDAYKIYLVSFDAVLSTAT